MTGVNIAGNYFISDAAEGTQTSPAIPSVSAGASGQDDTSVTPVSTVTDVSAIAAAAMPSIVAITDTMTVQQRDFFGMPQTYEAQSSGSGIIVGQNDTELLIATNNHVVDGATDLTVTFSDSQDVSAAVKGTDSATDLAIIAVQLSDIPSDTMSKIKVATMGDSDSLKVGQQVIAIGNALGYGQSVTVGYISALDREIQDENGITRSFIQTDAAINPGNSGGALLDLNGNVIGINAAKTASTGLCHPQQPGPGDLKQPYDKENQNRRRGRCTGLSWHPGHQYRCPDLSGIWYAGRHLHLQDRRGWSSRFL